jgi:hypothetical protein
LLGEAFATPADIQVVGNELHVRLDLLSAPSRTQVIAGLCEKLTATKAVYPGTDFTLGCSVEDDRRLPSDDRTMHGGLDSSPRRWGRAINSTSGGERQR